MEKIDQKENLIRLIDNYRNLIFSICLKMLGDYFVAEDLTQETFIAAYKNFSKFDGRSEKAWLCRIASNKCIDYLRKSERKTVVVLHEDIPETVLTNDNEPLRTVLNKELMKELENMCRALKYPYNEIAVKHFIEGKNAKEISEASGKGIKTVQTQIYRARELLKKSYRKEMLEI